MEFQDMHIRRVDNLMGHCNEIQAKECSNRHNWIEQATTTNIIRNRRYQQVPIIKYKHY